MFQLLYGILLFIIGIVFIGFIIWLGTFLLGVFGFWGFVAFVLILFLLK